MFTASYKMNIFVILVMISLNQMIKSTNIPYADEEDDIRFGKPQEPQLLEESNFGIEGFSSLTKNVQTLVSLHFNWEDTNYRKNALDLMFSKFLEKNNRQYINLKERLFRRQIFENNMERAARINHQYALGKIKFYLGPTKFSDWTDEEFMNKYTTQMPDTRKQKENNIYENITVKDPIPTEVDFRDKNVVGPIEDQGECGSCYSFTSVGATESAYALKYNGSRSFRQLSKQQMVDCGPQTSQYLRGCNGGILESAFTYLRDKGVAESSNYPYIGKVGKCKPIKPFLTTRGYNMLRNVNKDGILTMLAKTPVAMAMQTLPYLRHYEGGIVDIKGPCGFFYNHAILAVGYDNETEFPYFILKNTFGDQWGDNGYMYYQIGIGSAGMCGIINDNASHPVI